jgi:organic radical activating enzyme
MTGRDWLLVSEQFLSHQGEGPSAGQLAYFLRLGGCNLNCRWCDTAYTWAFDKRHADMHADGKQYDPKVELKRLTVHELAQQIPVFQAPLCVITGGEPLLQRELISELISEINVDTVMNFEIETAGTILPGELRVYENLRFNVSPKLASSGNRFTKRYIPSALIQLAGLQTDFKFVVDTRQGMTETVRHDLSEIKFIEANCEIEPHQIWLMPCGTTSRAINDGLEVLAPLALEHGWNISSRLQVLAYGDKRGT